jgi:hypothetical protein
MSRRISLVEGLTRERQPVDPIAERKFLKGVGVAPLPNPSPEISEPQYPENEQGVVPSQDEIRRVENALSNQPRKPKRSKVQPVGLIPVTIRLTPEIAGALKRASLERQLAGEDLFTQQEIVEQALEPWLRGAGYV